MNTQLNTRHRRLFFGIWPDEASRQGLLAWQRWMAWPAGARCTAGQDLHLTLHFIGELPAATFRSLLARVDLPAPRLAFDLDEAVLWHCGLVALRPRAAPAALLDLQHALASLLLQTGIAVDRRPYAPHVTVARNAGGTWPQGFGVEPIRWTSRGYRLAARSGAHYAAVASFEPP